MVKRLAKHLRSVLLLTGVFVASPFLLAKAGFWEASVANEVAFSTASAPFDRTGTVSYSQAVLRAAPAVVSINTSKKVSGQQSTPSHPLLSDPFFQHFFGGEAPSQETHAQPTPGLGSGVIVHESGYILTNNHVVQDADEITVTLHDGRSEVASIVGVDPDSDLAVLQVSLENLPVITFGNSDEMVVGDVVLAIGNPYGVGQTVTQGIISATQRTNLGINTFENFIQTDAAINPGNSGGALVDAYGNLIAINSAILSSVGAYQGIGFATPVNLAKTVMQQIIAQGHVVRGWLGISVRRLTDDLRASLKYEDGEGTVVAGVLRDGPAQQAGIMPGDIIVSINDKSTASPNDVLQVTASLEPQESYPMVVIRDGHTFDFRVTVGTRPTKE